MSRLLLISFVVGVRMHAAEFSRDIAPVLITECLACHSAEKAKGGYRVHTYSALVRAGKSKERAVVPGEPDASELFKRLITHDEDERMPQDDDPLTTEQISLFREWIAAGATLDRGETNSPLALLIPRPAHPAPPETYRRAVPVLAMAFASEGKSIAVSGHHEITVWSLEGKLQTRITNVPARVHAIAFHPSTNLFAVAGGKPGRQGELSVYQNNAFLTNLAQQSDELLTAAFSPDGLMVAAGGSDNAIRIYSTSTFEKLISIQQHADWVTSLSFSSNSAKILSTSRDRTARIYDARTGELETTYPMHSAAVTAAAFIPGERVASGGREKTIHLWDIKEGKKRHEISGAEAEITELIATEGFIFAAGADKKIRQYKISDRKLIRTYDGHTSAVFSLALSSDKLASGSFDGTVKIWNIKDGSCASTFAASPLAPALSWGAEK